MLKRIARELRQRIVQLVANKVMQSILKSITPYLLGTVLPFCLGVLAVVLVGGCLLSIMGVAKIKLTTLPKDDGEWVISAKGKTEIPSNYIPIYQQIGNKYHVPWNLLAAMHKVETSFGRNLSTSYAGAVGHFQFMPCNWLGWNYYKNSCDRLGSFLPGVHIDLTNPKNLHGGQAVDQNKDGKIDPNNIYDSMGSAAKRLASDKKRTGKGWFDRGGPVWKYNPSQDYVSKVEQNFELFASEKQPSTPVVSQSNGSISSALYWPAQGKITGIFGESRPGHFHKGIDIAAPMKTPIYAAADGVVTRSKTDPGGFGYYVVVSHGTILGRKVETWYGHMKKSSVEVKVGDKVKRAEKIAMVGNEGHSSGPHLHFEVRINDKPVNPLEWLKR